MIKNYALPKLIYALSSLPNPSPQTVKRIEKLMYEFIWDGKPEKIERDILTMGRITQNRFLNDVLLSWCRCKSNVVIQSYRHEILWNNSNVKAGVNTIMFSNWFHNGIKVLKDIFDDASKKFYPFSRLREIYNPPEGEFLKYLTLTHSKPHSWKTNIQSSKVKGLFPHSFKLIPLLSIATRPW